MSLRLSILPGRLAVCRLAPSEAAPAWAAGADFFSITRTPEELSVVCLEAQVPDGVRAEKGWRGLRVEGPLDFALIGILAGLAGALAQAGISLFALSTFDTDYLLVREPDLPEAVKALERAGYVVEGNVRKGSSRSSKFFIPLV